MICSTVDLRGQDTQEGHGGILLSGLSLPSALGSWKLHPGQRAEPSKGQSSRECHASRWLGLPDERALLQELSAEVQGNVLTVHHT